MLFNELNQHELYRVCNNGCLLLLSFKDSKRRTHQSHSADSNDVEERVDMLARVAIKFLNGCFQKSDPRVRGQTVDEVSCFIFMFCVVWSDNHKNA